MKRMIALMLALVMVMLMVASCGDSSVDNTTDSAITTEKTDATTAPDNTTSSTTDTAATTAVATTTGTTEATEATTVVIPTIEPSGNPEDPILWLDFEVENIYGDTILDMSGHGNNAKITGSPSYIAGPTGGNAINFGKGSTFDFLTILNNDTLNFAITDEFTVDFWYKLDSDAMGWENLFSKGTQNNGWYGVWLGTNDNSNQGVCWGGDTGNTKIGSLYSKGKWHHITVIQKNGVLYMFLDGEQVASDTAVNCKSNGNMYIGGRNSTSTNTDASAQFNGSIDDFKIYNYAVEVEGMKSSINEAESLSYTYTSADGTKITLPYRVYYPSDYDAEGDKEYPILLFLHGHGECGTNNTSQLMVLNAANYFLDDIAAMDNCIILAPQTVCDGATNVKEWVASGSGKSGVHQWDSSAGGLNIRQGELEDITYTVGLQAVSALLDEFLALNTVDKDRVYIGGISMGGCGTWELIARRPDTFAAAVPVCGSGIIRTAALLTDIDIWAFHGTADTTVYTAGSTNMVQAIKDAGGTKATVTTFSGVGHSVWNYAYTAVNDDGLTAAQWLLQQTKAD